MLFRSFSVVWQCQNALLGWNLAVLIELEKLVDRARASVRGPVGLVQIGSLIEQPDPHAPLGAKGVGEPPTISSTPAIVAAIRDALRHAGVERELARVPVRPADICLSP